MLPYRGPYQELELTANIVRFVHVDQHDERTIMVNRDQVTKCPAEHPDVTCMVPKKLGA